MSFLKNTYLFIFSWITLICSPLQAAQINSISPDSGPINGGTVVSIIGSGFNQVTAISFGSTTLSSINNPSPTTPGTYHINSDTLITAVSPPTNNGISNASITLYTSAGTLSFDYFQYEIVSSVIPGAASTAGGTPINITGFGLTSVTTISFGSIQLTRTSHNPPTIPGTFYINSDELITVLSPPYSSAAIIPITVQTSAGTQSILFNYIAGAIANVSPIGSSVNGGITVTITGNGYTNFTKTTSVQFGSTPANQYTVVSDNLIKAIAPSPNLYSPQEEPITVTTPTASYTTPFYYGLVITKISPTIASTSGGTQITLTGYGLNAYNLIEVAQGPYATPLVPSGGRQQFPVNSEGTKLIITAPAESAGEYEIVVLLPQFNTQSSIPLTYQNPNPSFVSLSVPDKGSVKGGTIVGVVGAGFKTNPPPIVYFGDTPATTLNVKSDTVMEVLSPPGIVPLVTETSNNMALAASTNVITVPLSINSPGSSNVQFTYRINDDDPELPAYVEEPIPNQGPASGGTQVKIIGTGFIKVTSVQFGSTVLSSDQYIVHSDDLITAISPSEQAGTVDIIINTRVGRSVSGPNSQFTYEESILSPRDVNIKNLKNRFSTQTDLINLITWKAPSSSSSITPVSYRIYLDAGLQNLVGEVSTRNNLEFAVHNRKKGHSYRYYIVSVDVQGQVSTPVKVKSQPFN